MTAPGAAGGTRKRPSIRVVAGMTLVALAIAAAAYGVVREARRSGREIAPSSPPALAAASDTVTTVYYFHGDRRCVTCQTIEKQAGETVQTMFADDIAAGRLRFQAVNYDAPEHAHFREDFDLSFGSVVVCRGSRFENLSDVWTLVDTRDAFDRYIVEHVSPFLRDAP